MLVALPSSFTQLFREHAPHAGRALRNLGVREADLPDVLQEVFVVVHRKLPSFLGNSTLRTWIYGICLRVAAAHRRRPHRLLEVELEQAGTVRAQGSPHEDAERREALGKLDEVLSRLDEDKRAVFVLYELEELTLAEIAAATGAPIPTVYSRLQAARRLVQSAFGEAHGAAEQVRPDEQRT